MKQIELIDKRKKREKHFLKENGDFVVEMYDEDIHFLRNGKYEEIDNTLVLNNGYYTNKNNDYKVSFANEVKSNLIKIEKLGHYINIGLEKCSHFTVQKDESNSKFTDSIKYINVFKNIDICYDLTSSKIKESIFINEKNSEIDKLVFNIYTDLDLKLNPNNSIISAIYNNEILFNIDAPYMMDSRGNINNNIYYNLIKDEDVYQLQMVLDYKWLDSDISYPVIIDPTIKNFSNENNVYDTYIYPGDTNIDRDSLGYLKVGVEKVDGNDVTNRTLLKFDLPVIGTGSQVINAQLSLFNYPYITSEVLNDIINIHRVTMDWDESTANWITMNDKYDNRVDGVIDFFGVYYVDSDNIPIATTSSADITSLVQKWYTGTQNYGIMMKLDKEVYKSNLIPLFISKNNTPNKDARPMLVVTYRNQNGLERYMNYESHSFTKGAAYHNTYNGNLTTVFNIGSSKTGKMPVNLRLVYNTNDVVLNSNIGYGIGYRLNFNQTIKEVTIDNKTYLEYVDEDGTIHYFLNEKIEFGENGPVISSSGNIFYDEDGLDLEIEKLDTKLILRDKNGNQMTFEKYNNVAYLTKIEDVSGNINTIFYDVEYKKIFKIKDANNQSIDINYNRNNIISVISPDEEVTLSFLDSNILGSIVYRDGTIYINHNEKYLVWGITDITGKRIEYEYYSESPYKLKKVTEFGLNNTIGSYYNTDYGFNVTTITDSKGRARSITFNSIGNPSSISSLKSKDDITDAYGSAVEYGETHLKNNNYKNKLLSSKIPLKYVKNLLTNTSFENNMTDFVSNDYGESVISNEYSNTGFNSLKFSSMYDNAKVSNSIDVTKGKYYTFSAYVKTALYSTPVRLCMYYENEEGRYIEMCSDGITTGNDFERLDLTIFYPETARSSLGLGICMNGKGLCYIDDVQLEEGEVVNNYNLIENSDFSNGINDWNLYTMDGYDISEIFNVVDIANQKALKVNMHTSNGSSLEKNFKICGKKYDRFTLSFWYKNKGLTGAEDGIGGGPKNNVSIIFYPVDEMIGGDVFDDFTLNPNENEWQFFTHDFYADYDFKEFKLNFYQNLNGNEFYITNINLFKDVRSVTYDYDENGNVIKSKNLNDKTNEFNYDKNNQLIKMIDPKGSNFHYEYDNVVTDRVLRGVSKTGISNEIEYDCFGNPIVSRVINRGQMMDAKNGTYKIRLKGTNKCLRLINNSMSLFDDVHGHNKWTLEKLTIDEIDYYKIYHEIISNKYITVSDSSVSLLSYQNDNSLFELIKQDNGSFYIKSKLNDKYLKNSDNILILSDLIENDENFEFYFESNTNSMFIENSAEYTEDGKFITKTIDTNFNEINYDIDNMTGLIKSVTNSKNQTTYYNYNYFKQLESIIDGDRIVNYEYNSNRILSSITQGNRTYNFEYDSFLNIKSIKIGNDITLITNKYEDNNGNLISTTYGNNNTISYEYDEFNRIKKIIKNDDSYNYKYNNNGNLVKIISNNDIIKYTYDLAKRLYEYKFNDFNIKYGYDSNDNVITKKYELGNIIHNINNTLNEDDMLIKTTIDNDEINYNYDSLGRLINSNINNNYKTSYEYITNGKRTSMLVKSISNNNDKYSYNYDKLGNITHIYHNDVLENKYYYDDYNELIKDDNYITNKTTIYEYDNLGNILYEKVYDVDTNSELYKNKYEYNNAKWKDQLTKYNDDIITYDSLGNPLTIGNDITLTWINGRQLNSYTDSSNTINYKYNVAGIRTNKIINNVETKYYLEESKIILEVNSDNVLYYIRSKLNGLIGFKYNNDVYYYIKNNQDDIIGILDSHYDVVTKYTYDSWGNILSITDGNGVDVSSNSKHIANINPYRYRSYYYDKETKLYYLNSRYYNPRWGRFINLDGIISSGDTIKGNLYSYCNNDPINNVDSNGQFSFKKLIKQAFKVISKAIDTAKKTVGKILSAKRVSKKDEIYGGIDLIVADIEPTQTDTTTISKIGSDDSMFKITSYKPEKLFDLKKLKVNFNTTEFSTNTGNFDIGFETGDGWAINASWKTDSGYGNLSMGINMFGKVFVDFGTSSEESLGNQQYDHTNFGINAPACLSFAYAYDTVTSLSALLKQIMSSPLKAYA